IPPHRNTANTDSPPNSRPPLHRSHDRGTSNSGDPPTTAWQAQGVPSPRHKTSRIAARTVPSSPHSLRDTADVKGSERPSTTPPQNVVLAFLVFSTSSNHQLLCLSAHFLAILPSLCAAVAPICFALLHFFRADSRNALTSAESSASTAPKNSGQRVSMSETSSRLNALRIACSSVGKTKCPRNESFP